MTTIAKMKPVEKHQEQQTPLRFVTAASLFDGHDASINVMRRILQSKGVEVIHLAHNRSVDEVVRAAIQEGANAIAISSYQGGHVEYFQYILKQLRDSGAGHIKLFGGGGGVIVEQEIKLLEESGVEKIYSPQDGMRMGLEGMIDDMIARCLPINNTAIDVQVLLDDSSNLSLSRLIDLAESNAWTEEDVLNKGLVNKGVAPVLGITGTGGAGKSSLTDELIRRFRIDSGDDVRIAVLAIDPTRRKTGGALLGDRIRMNAVYADNVYLRSIATRSAKAEVPQALRAIIAITQQSNFDLIIIETPGIGQGDAGIVPYVDSAIYVMTPEFGAQSQLEKIDMLDFADLVIINKYDRKGAEDALRDVRKQVQRNREQWQADVDSMPVFGSIASRFNDDGVSAAYFAALDVLREKGLKQWQSRLERVDTTASTKRDQIIASGRQRYLEEIATAVRDYHTEASNQADIAAEIQSLETSQQILDTKNDELVDLIDSRRQQLTPQNQELIQQWPELSERYRADEFETSSARFRLKRESLSGSLISRVSLPTYSGHADLLRWLLRENLPGFFPFTAGVFAFKRESEDPTRMFAGEGDPSRTNRRFHRLSEHAAAARLSTAFDSVTLYGNDPAERPDIYGKIGNSGVSVATLDDMKQLYSGFDLCAPTTSVSMTINGPAPAILAMFLNTAIDQQLERFEQEHKRAASEEEREAIQSEALRKVRGTVQADILKEDQGQNTCIFSTEFSLRMMGDMQQYFIDHQIRNFYSVSISGYHIAEAGANPITQLAFTLANGFTFVEAYLARGMKVDDFAPNFSFFFSNGMDPEYTVIGRVARRIWAVAMRDKYGANQRSQKLKYHIQTSGRSLHAQEIQFNDIRTTLQAVLAINDNCNSLHTNAYDEAITTPTDESVRRALAIQLIINREFGLAKNENPNQGAFIIEELTDLVEEAVLTEFERLSDRGGVLGAMERGYQRGKIQEESLKYEHLKHSGALPLIGVNTFLADSDEPEKELQLARSTENEKRSQIERVNAFKEIHAEQSEKDLAQLKEAIRTGENGFTALMSAVRSCSLGQLTDAFFEVGGQYRRSM